jgi:hypothetical protein|tara:strand:+ start:1598 stop:2350 length:753 start_codon:yes stop_codon:yes gene_type:complete
MSYTPFQKYLYEAIGRPESGIRMYHKPPFGTSPKPKPITPTMEPELEDEDEDEGQPGNVPDMFNDEMQQSVLELIQWMYENLNLPIGWDLIFDILMAGGDWDAHDVDGDGDIDMDDLYQTFIEDWLLNEDGSINAENIWEAFMYIGDFFGNWGDASLGGQVSDFPFRGVIANGWFGQGGVFGEIFTALQELQGLLEDGEIDGDYNGDGVNNLLQLILALIEVINKQQLGVVTLPDGTMILPDGTIYNPAG